MKKAWCSIVSVVLVYAGLCLPLSAWWPKSVATSWPFAYWRETTRGKIDKGLHAKIYSTRFVVLPGQEYEIRMLLRNTGSKPVVVDTFPYVTNKDWNNFVLDGELIGNLRISEKKTLTIKPGQTIDLSVFEGDMSPCTRKAKGMRVYGYQAHTVFQTGADFLGVTSNRINILEVPTPVDLTLLAALCGIIVYRGKKRSGFSL